MKSLTAGMYLLAIACIFSSCAATYKPIHPDKLHYPSNDQDNGFQYKYDVLMMSNNRKFAKKELNSQIRVVAVKIFNTTGQTLKYGVNYRLYFGDREAEVLPISEVTRHIRETVPTYLLYLLLTPTVLHTDGSSSQNIPIGLVLGPGITALNIGIAAGANKNFRREMEQFDLAGKEIANGETAYGLIGIQSQDLAPLYMKVLDK